MKDETIIDRDRQWFKRHPGRKHYCRLASELEEAEVREKKGETRIAWCVVFVRRVSSKIRVRNVRFIPIIDGRELVLPKDEETCAELSETAFICFEMIVDDRVAISAGHQCQDPSVVEMHERLDAISRTM